MRADAIDTDLSKEAAFERLALEELPVLYRVARRVVRDAAEAEDLVSQTLLAAAKGWTSFDGRFGRSWLIKIMKNEHLRNIRTRNSRAQTVSFEEVPEPHDQADTWRDLDAKLITDQVVCQLDAVPEEYRLAVVLCDIEQMSYEEAANALEVPVGTIRSRLFRGRRILREKLALEVQP